MAGPLTVLSDLSERLHYNVADFPLYTRKDELHRYGYAAVCHWHPDLEFIFIESGIMDYFVNGRIVHMEKGQGIFVNSRRLHYGFSKAHDECTFIALVIHPRIFIQNTQAGMDYMHIKIRAGKSGLYSAGAGNSMAERSAGQDSVNSCGHGEY